MDIAVERVVADEVVAALYPVYVEAWGPLVSEAAARHVLTEAEFAEEMADPRIEKFLVRDHGEVVGLTTVTTDLSAIDWINADYYSAQFPDVVARHALFYLGYTLVAQTHRRSKALITMSHEIDRRIAQARGLIGFDICGYNNDHGIGRQTARLFRNHTHIRTLDTQTYYAADYRLPEGETEGRPRGADIRVTSLQEQPELVDGLLALLATRWPAFMLAGHAGHGADLPSLLLTHPHHQVVLVDGDDQVVGAGLSVPIAWDGTTEHLPGGWDDAVSQAAARRASDPPADAVCALSITVAKHVGGRRLSRLVLQALKRAAAEAGATSLVAPIRPVLKSGYPLVGMDAYLLWRRDDGRAFDPWVRLHESAGGVQLRVAPDSMVVSGTVAEWETWLGERLPGSGAFVVKGGLVPLEVDAAADRAVYREPNVWFAHRLT